MNSWQNYMEQQKAKLRRLYGDPFYESEAWQQLRYQTLLRFEGRCMACGCRPHRGNSIQVDHIKPRSKYPELELEPSNLQVLCRDCNFGKGGWDETDWRWK